MNARTNLASADLTTPLLSPEILSSFEALSEGRCTLSELNRSVLEACRDDPAATAGVLLLLEGYSNSGELDQQDFGPLKRELERRQGIQDPMLELDVEPGQDLNARHGRLAHLDIEPRSESGAATPTTDDEIDPASGDRSGEPVNDLPDNEVTGTPAEPKTLRGRYILQNEIGRGGAGIVYRALDLNRAGLPHEHQYVALKVLREEHARRPDAVDALRREYHPAQLLSHPGIVNVFDFDHDDGTYFVTMELLDGEPLGALIRRLQPNKLPLEAATRILRELGDAVAYAHDRGVLHLDLKPDNVIVDPHGHARALDFGLAQPHRAEPWISEMQPSPPAAATLAYASYERLVGERPDVRDDIFSFSCLTYELLSGKHPFDRYSAFKARKEGCKARRIRGLSRHRWHVLKSGLAWARGDRPANMRELLHGLALQSSTPARTAHRQMGWQPIAAVALLILGIAAVLSWDRLANDLRASLEERVGSAGQTLVQKVNGARRWADTLTAAPASAALDRTRGEAGHTTPEVVEPVHAQLGKAETDDAEQGMPAASADAAAPPQGGSAIVASSIPDPAAAIESASPVAEPPSLPTDAPLETADVDPAPMHGSPEPAKAAAASKAMPVSPTPIAEELDVVEFTRHSFSVSEADPVVRLTVRRRGGAAEEISFEWHTVDDSAIARVDYAPGTVEEVMAAGQTTATLVVPIVADSVAEYPELLQVVIGNARGARVGAASRAPVIIVDDD
jgi:serine/threonine protein kinase